MTKHCTCCDKELPDQQPWDDNQLCESCDERRWFYYGVIEQEELEARPEEV